MVPHLNVSEGFLEQEGRQGCSELPWLKSGDKLVSLVVGTTCLGME